jgi:hypothetical protein
MWRAAPCSLPPSLVEGLACWLLLQALFTESLHGEQLLAPSPFSGALKAPCLSAAFPFQFLVYYSVFFYGAGVSLSGGLCWFIPGVAVWVPHAVYLLTCCSASHKQIWSWHLAVRVPSWFLSIKTRCGEALYGWGFVVLEFCLFLVVFSCQVWLQHLSKIFDLGISCCLLPPSSHHLGSPQVRTLILNDLFSLDNFTKK